MTTHAQMKDHIREIVQRAADGFDVDEQVDNILTVIGVSVRHEFATVHGADGIADYIEFDPEVFL